MDAITLKIKTSIEVFFAIFLIMTQEEFDYIEKNGTEHCDTTQEFIEYTKQKKENQKISDADNRDACSW